MSAIECKGLGVELNDRAFTQQARGFRFHPKNQQKMGAGILNLKEGSKAHGTANSHFCLFV